MAFWQWSKTAANNGNSDASINYQEGEPPALLNDAGRALMARAAEYRDDTSGLLLTAGTSTAYTVTTNQGLPATPNDGQLLVVSFHTTNGANPTLAADGGTAFPIQAFSGTAIAAGTLFGASVPLRFRAASSAWVMFEAGSATVAAAVVNGGITNAMLANAPAWTLKGNPTGGSTSPSDFTIAQLVVKAVPVAGDEVLIWDSVASAMKSATIATLGKANTAPTVQTFTSGTSLTYTPTAGMVRIKVRMVGGGGGGGAAVTNNGSTGTATSFGTWTANPGSGGAAAAGAGGGGGNGGTNGTGTPVVRLNGGAGIGGASNGGGAGGNNPFGGGGGGNGPGQAGQAGAPNTGAGGSAGNAGGANNGGAGGGSGEYVEFWMTAAQVGASQIYTVGPGGAGGAAGTQPGGNGAAGIIIIEEFYV